MASFCIRCDSAIAPRDGCCLACGAAALRPCRGCGAGAPPDARFCAECGMALAAIAPDSATAWPAQPPRGSPGGSPGQLPGRPSLQPAIQASERKLVTVMFVDMIGSLASIRDADPEEAHE